MNKPIFLGVELSELLNRVRQICREEISEILQKSLVQAKPDDEFLDMDQASVFTKKAKQTLYGLCSSNSIPHFSKSGQNYFKKQELIEWIESGRKSKKKEVQPNRLLFTKKTQSLKKDCKWENLYGFLDSLHSFTTKVLI